MKVEYIAPPVVEGKVIVEFSESEARSLRTLAGSLTSPIHGFDTWSLYTQLSEALNGR